MENIYSERIKRLRSVMKREQADAYLVPSGDFHGSEYVGAAFRVREYLSGFTGSAGTLAVTMTDAGLWTDGRYYLQAEKELGGSGIRLFRAGEKQVPTIKEYLKQSLRPGQTLAFDGRIVSAGTGLEYEREWAALGIKLMYDQDLAAALWPARPALSCEPVRVLDEEWSGRSVGDKLKAVRGRIEQAGAEALLLTKLDDLMWLFNLRGNDVPGNPVALSYGYLDLRDGYLFIQAAAVSEEVRAHLTAEGIRIAAYEQIYEWLRRPRHQKIMLDRGMCNYMLYKLVEKQAEPILADNPTTLMKAVKNPVELAHLREIYRRDSAAVIRFMKWMKEQGRYNKITEVTAAAFLDRLRYESKDFMDYSFPTICAAGENAAMMHYEARPGSCKVISPQGLLLVDSGGQYRGGTTDVTRTLVLGAISADIKRQYTAVVRGMLGLSGAVFCHGCTGRNLDILARGPLWEMGIDYKCGTGHGIGYMLSVHEGPQSIRWAYRPESRETVLEAGMLLSNEPGVYRAGSHGIRVENIMAVKEVMQNEDGRFMGFETLTLVPIDREGIAGEMMTRTELAALNRYHQRVYAEMKDYLNADEQEWLADATKAIE